MAIMQLGNDQLKENLKTFTLETPGWAYGDGGTRFLINKHQGAARDIYHKIEDAAIVHQITGIAPLISLHVARDIDLKNVDRVIQAANRFNIEIGSINPDLFGYDEFRLGSLTHSDPAIREKAVRHILQCIEIMKICGSKVLNVWLSDGTNYPGQDSFRKRKHRLLEGLQQIYDHLDATMQIFIEYKLFEPAFYSTDIPDWGTAFMLASKCGPNAKVLVDIGHHPLGTNIEQIVSTLMDEHILGGLHLNSKKYADDDLTAGSLNPYELFLIFCELSSGTDPLPLLVIDQCHNLKPKIEEMIQTIVNVQELYTKSLLVDRDALDQAQRSGEIIKAEELLRGAFFTDVRPLLAEFKHEMGLPINALDAYRESGYQDKIEITRT